MARYREAIKGALAQIDSDTNDPSLKIERYAELFANSVRSGCICLGGMLATDLMTLPQAVQTEVKKFFSENEAWLSSVLNAGRESGQFTFEGSPKNKAETIFSALEGAMIAARLFNDEKRLLSAAQWVLHALSDRR